MLSNPDNTIQTRDPLGRWQPGASGNPGGRPRGEARLREMAQSRADEALRVLGEIMTDRSQPAAARCVAARLLLDRAYGRPGAAVQDAGDDMVELIDPNPDI